MKELAGFVGGLARAVLAPVGGPRVSLPVFGAVVAIGIAMALRAAGVVTDGLAADVTSAPASETDQLIERARTLRRLWTDVEVFYEREIAPLERVLKRYRDDPDLVRRIALSLSFESRRVDIDARVLLAVLLVENPWLDPTARSSVGAVGLMQVMPLHRGKWYPCGDDLEEVEANICYGARIFAHYYRLAGGDIERALLRYNGCVRGANTPNCHTYPFHVFARAGRASILGWLEPDPAEKAALPRDKEMK